MHIVKKCIEAKQIDIYEKVSLSYTGGNCYHQFCVCVLSQECMHRLIKYEYGFLKTQTGEH